VVGGWLVMVFGLCVFELKVVKYKFQYTVNGCNNATWPNTLDNVSLCLVGAVVSIIQMPSSVNGKYSRVTLLKNMPSNTN
jgi:hypothetical protein